MPPSRSSPRSPTAGWLHFDGRRSAGATPPAELAADAVRGTGASFVPTELPVHAVSCAHGPRSNVGDTRTRCLLVVVMSDRSQSVSGSNNVDSFRLIAHAESVRPTFGRARPPTARTETRLVARRPGVAMRPTALRADVYAGTERPAGIDREAVMQRDLLSTVCEQQRAARRAVECCSDTQPCQELF